MCGDTLHAAMAILMRGHAADHNGSNRFGSRLMMTICDDTGEEFYTHDECCESEEVFCYLDIICAEGLCAMLSPLLLLLHLLWIPLKLHGDKQTKNTHLQPQPKICNRTYLSGGGYILKKLGHPSNSMDF